MDLATQYNNFADDFSNFHDSEAGNRFNRETFYTYTNFIEKGWKLLDVGCGDGLDLTHYEKLGAQVFGIDASEKLVAIAKERLPRADIRVGLFEKMPFENDFFDAVFSKYAIMTSSDMQPVFHEIWRVLKPGGTMVYLVTHPFRQYFEKRNIKADYFERTIVDSHIFQNTLVIKEPTHTMGEYFNDFLFKYFDVQYYDEQWDPAAEHIDGKKYPGFFILAAKKKMVF